MWCSRDATNLPSEKTPKAECRQLKGGVYSSGTVALTFLTCVWTESRQWIFRRHAVRIALLSFSPVNWVQMSPIMSEGRSPHPCRNCSAPLVTEPTTTGSHLSHGHHAFFVILSYCPKTHMKLARWRLWRGVRQRVASRCHQRTPSQTPSHRDTSARAVPPSNPYSSFCIRPCPTSCACATCVTFSRLNDAVTESTRASARGMQMFDKMACAFIGRGGSHEGSQHDSGFLVGPSPLSASSQTS